jgi:hypothetical protein
VNSYSVPYAVLGGGDMDENKTQLIPSMELVFLVLEEDKKIK